jgi:hypothetical protein
MNKAMNIWEIMDAMGMRYHRDKDGRIYVEDNECYWLLTLNDKDEVIKVEND